ncbi:hypothetical protein DPEC_G00139640 [Dallia pectoralis]|uniref:Uncharacterized protein n=1 Tax=Dallia pectoralis TaxID=75939 RepID=A0ACC2GMR5_DALPE|nr:hypothetical protein DPEC_G00139640 [Dallia pectoralis]
MSWDCGLRYMFSVSPALQPGSEGRMPDKEDLSHLEMVQKLAKDGCRFLRNHGNDKAPPERTTESQFLEANMEINSHGRNLSYSLLDDIH